MEYLTIAYGIFARLMFYISGATALFVICYDIKRAWPRILAALRGEPYEEPVDDHHPWK